MHGQRIIRSVLKKSNNTRSRIKYTKIICGLQNPISHYVETIFHANLQQAAFIHLSEP